MHYSSLVKIHFYFILFLVSFSFQAQSAKNDYERTRTGVQYSHKNSKIAINILSPTIVKIAVGSNDSLLEIPSIIASDKLQEHVSFKVKNNSKKLVLKTDSLIVSLDKQNGLISYFTNKKQLLLSESGREFVAFDEGSINSPFRISQSFDWSKSEVLYGLGQHELESLNIRNQKVVLEQKNTRIAIPVIVSPKGYGIYWDNYSSSVFDGTINSPTISSKVADKIQYYFVKGSRIDNVIGGLRDLTGASPMLPRWAFGYFQSRNRYKNKEELVGVVKKHRELNIPLDAVILDYLHWNKEGFGSMNFDSIAFPEPEKMIEELHETYNSKLVVSVWPSFFKGNDNWKLFEKDNLLMGIKLGVFGQVYDAFNPKAGELYWKLVRQNYWDKGVDGIWFDATEPEKVERYPNAKCHLGSFSKYQNLYSYFDMKNVFDNQSKVSKKRVFILTRSSFLGQQKFGTVAWSGDIGTDFKTLKQQISSGLNYCITGMPYWNTDIGGYLGGDSSDPKYQEVFVRWFQYGAFTPFFRAHGRRVPFESRSGENEIWSYGEDNQKILTNYINLRYRLLPYIYTLSYKISAEHYTMMRVLAFDFPNDKKALEVNDQYLFGDLLVCPVTESGVVNREVYLPEGENWVDFWTGKMYKGGVIISAVSPLDKMPVYVKSGTVLPLADVMQYSNEKPLDEIELRIYPGKDASFSLYEDEEDNYNYMAGVFTQIPITYSEKDKTIVLGDIVGAYNGMLKERVFNIVLVNEGEGVGVSSVNRNKVVVEYSGDRLEVKL